MGKPPEREVVTWCSDASVLSRYGIETVNYGPSSGPRDDEGEKVRIKTLVDITKIYALTAAELCGVQSRLSQSASQQPKLRRPLPSQKEIDRRYKNIRSRMEREGLDALIVCGNQYAGFEGAVFYVSGFEIVHRYVYVVLPLEGEPTLVFPREARWIGDKAKPGSKTMSGRMFREAGCASEGRNAMEARRCLRHELHHGRARLSRTGQGLIRTCSL